MADYKDKILQAKGRIERAQEDLLNIYFTKIKERYKNFESRQREILLDNLNLFTQKLEKGNLLKKILTYKTTRKNLDYNGGKAREIREKAGFIKLTGLIKQLGIKDINSSRNQLSNYEFGNVSPSNPPRGEFSKKYMGWLKEQGYNPFDL